MHQRRIPARCQANRLRIRGALDSDVAVEALLMKEHWDSQPGVLFQPLLYRIRELRHLAGATSLARTRHLSQAILQQHCGALGKEISFLVNKHRLRIGMKLAILPST